MEARIYQPTKTAMQSGKAKTKRWLLEFTPENPTFIDPLMGWTGMTDMNQQIHIFFDSEEEAIAYAKRQNIPYVVLQPKRPKVKIKSYAENFK